MKIELTKDQAEAFQRGESITLSPPPTTTQHHIAVHKTGMAFLLEGDPAACKRWQRLRNAYGRPSRYLSLNEWRGNSYGGFDFTRSGNYTIVPVERQGPWRADAHRV